MGQNTRTASAVAEKAVKDIRRKTRKRYSTEDKIRIVLAGLRGEDSIAELCRQEGISQGLYYSWSKEFLEAGKSDLPETPPVRPIPVRSSSCVKKRATLKKCLQSRPLNCGFLKKACSTMGRTTNEVSCP